MDIILKDWMNKMKRLNKKHEDWTKYWMTSTNLKRIIEYCYTTGQACTKCIWFVYMDAVHLKIK